VAQSQTVKSMNEPVSPRSSRARCALTLAALIPACVFFSFQGCARAPGQPGDNDCEKFERALADADQDECLQAKQRCLAALDRAIKDHNEQMQILLTALGADTERERALRPAVAKLEKDLSELKTKRERFNAAHCDKPEG
jgi:septal ring factor EnvC (AmiA/AmiB activator)